MELAIRVKDRPFRDKRSAAELTGRGDVISVRPDGWAWSQRERESPEWVIVQVDILPIEADALVCPEINAGNHKPYCFKRQYKLDLDGLGIKPGDRIQKIKKVNISDYMIHKGCACAK